MINKSILLQDIAKEITPQDIVREFHLNTIINRIFWILELNSQKNLQNTITLTDWVSKAKRLADLLPEDYKVKDAITKSQINPFRGFKTCFTELQEIKKEYPSKSLNPSYSEVSSNTPNIYTAVVNMHIASLGQFPNDHLNILEILCGATEITEMDIKRFCQENLNQKETPNEAIENFINEMVGSSMLNECQAIELSKGNTLFQSQHSQPHQLGVELNNKLYIEGYYGSKSEFDLFKSQDQGINHIVVIERNNRQQTSVTNLAEQVRDTLKNHYGDNTKIYEAYEKDSNNGYFSQADEIIGNIRENAGWIPTNAEDIPGFSKFQLINLK